jgi:hypothetical protein
LLAHAEGHGQKKGLHRGETFRCISSWGANRVALTDS